MFKNTKKFLKDLFTFSVRDPIIPDNVEEPVVVVNQEPAVVLEDVPVVPKKSKFDAFWAIIDSNWTLIMVSLYLLVAIFMALTEGSPLEIFGRLIVVLLVIGWFASMAFLAFLGLSLATVQVYANLANVPVIGAFVAASLVVMFVKYQSVAVLWFRRLLVIIYGTALFLLIFRTMRIAWNMYQFKKVMKQREEEDGTVRHALDDFGKSYIKYRVRNEKIINRSRNSIDLFKQVFTVLDKLMDPAMNPCWNNCMPEDYHVIERSKYSAPIKRHSDNEILISDPEMDHEMAVVFDASVRADRLTQQPDEDLSKRQIKKLSKEIRSRLKSEFEMKDEFLSSKNYLELVKILNSEIQERSRASNSDDKSELEPRLNAESEITLTKTPEDAPDPELMRVLNPVTPKAEKFVPWWTEHKFALYFENVDGQDEFFLYPFKNYPDFSGFRRLEKAKGFIYKYPGRFYIVPSTLTEEELCTARPAKEMVSYTIRGSLQSKIPLDKPTFIDNKLLTYYMVSTCKRSITDFPVHNADWKQSREWVKDADLAAAIERYNPRKGMIEHEFAKLQNDIMRLRINQECKIPIHIWGVDDTTTHALNDAFVGLLLTNSDRKRDRIHAELKRNKIAPTILGTYESYMWIWNGDKVFEIDTGLLQASSKFGKVWDLEFSTLMPGFSMQSKLRSEFFVNLFGGEIRFDRNANSTSIYLPSDYDKWNAHVIEQLKIDDATPSIFSLAWAQYEKARSVFVGCLDKSSKLQRVLFLGASVITLCILGFYVYSRYFNVTEPEITRHFKGKTKHTKRGWTKKKRFRPMSPKEYDDRIQELTWLVEEAKKQHDFADEMSEGPARFELAQAEDDLQKVMRGARSRGFRHTEEKPIVKEKSEQVTHERFSEPQVAFHHSMRKVEVVHHRKDGTKVTHTGSIHCSSNSPSGKVLLITKHAFEPDDDKVLSLKTWKSNFNEGKNTYVEISCTIPFKKVADIGDLIAVDCPWNSIRVNVLPFVPNEDYPDTENVCVRYGRENIATKMINKNPNSIEKFVDLSLRPGFSGTPFFFYNGRKVPDAIAGIYVGGNEKENVGKISTVTKEFALKAGLKLKTLN